MTQANEEAPTVPETGLFLAPCDHAAAAYAVTQWHYSRRMPSAKLIRYGVWEDGVFIGAVIFGRGANRNLAGRFKLETTQACELVRVALTDHRAPVSRVVAIAIRLLRQSNPGLRLILSYADPAQGHHGGIYQAGNWLYVGSSIVQRALVVDGKPMHKRAASSAYGTAKPDAIAAMTGKVVTYGPKEAKHAYVYPLDAETRAALQPRVRPAPGRGKQAMTPDHGEQRRGSTDHHAPPASEADALALMS